MSDISTKEFVSTKGKPRSIEELVRLSCHLPRYLKAAFGPYRSDEEARRALQLATKLGFPIKLTNYTFGTVGKNAHGPQRAMRCTHQQCPYRVRYELVAVSPDRYEWYMERCTDQHSDHPMATTPAEIMAIPLNRHIPDDFIAIG